MRTISKQDQRLLITSYFVVVCFLCFIYLSGWTYNTIVVIYLSGWTDNTIAVIYLSGWTNNTIVVIYLSGWTNNTIAIIYLSGWTNNTITVIYLSGWANNTIAVIVRRIEFHKRRKEVFLYNYWPRKNSLSSFGQYNCYDSKLFQKIFVIRYAIQFWEYLENV